MQNISRLVILKNYDNYVVDFNLEKKSTEK